MIVENDKPFLKQLLVRYWAVIEMGCLVIRHQVTMWLSCPYEQGYVRPTKL